MVCWWCCRNRHGCRCDISARLLLQWCRNRLLSCRTRRSFSRRQWSRRHRSTRRSLHVHWDRRRALVHMHVHGRRRKTSVRMLLHVHGRHLSWRRHGHSLLHWRHLMLLLRWHRRHLLLLLYRRTLLLLFANDLDIRNSSALHRPLRPSRTAVREEDVLERQNTSGDFSYSALQDRVRRLLEGELDGRASKVGHGRCGRSSRDARVDSL